MSYTFLQKPRSFKRFSNLEKNCGADKCCKKWSLLGYTFLQKPSSFKFLSILEINCGADIINGTFKCKTFFTNDAQKKGGLIKQLKRVQKKNTDQAGPNKVYCDQI